jgi:putative polyketide hydroxylase
VLRGWAGPGLLDSYEDERRPWTAQTVDVSYRLNRQHRWAASRTLGHILGSAYEAGAFVPDGTPPPQIADPVAEYTPSARPGRRAPHVWLSREGSRVSTIDLFDGSFVLLSPSEGWCMSGREVAATLAVPFRAELIADAGWAETYEVGKLGAVLVRPDGHVALRADPAANLRRVLASVLDLPGQALAATGPITAARGTR